MPFLYLASRSDRSGWERATVLCSMLAQGLCTSEGGVCWLSDHKGFICNVSGHEKVKADCSPVCWQQTHLKSKTHSPVQTHASKAMWGCCEPLGSCSMGREWAGWFMAIEAASVELSTSQAWSTGTEAMVWAARVPKTAWQAGLARLGPQERTADQGVLKSNQPHLMSKTALQRSPRAKISMGGSRA